MILSLNKSFFKPFHIPDIIQYINEESNHPINLFKHLPMSIKKHLSSHSSDKQIFKKSAIYFEHPLNKADYTNKLVYNFPSTSNLENKNKNYFKLC